MIKTGDSPEIVNKKLESKYNTSLFDFAYLLAIALNENFLPQIYFGLRKRDVTEVTKKLKATKKISSQYYFLRDLIPFIDGKLVLIEKFTSQIKKPAGRYIEEKAKLILLWTQIVRKTRFKQTDIFYSQEGKEKKEKSIGLIDNVDWIGYQRLMKWFYNKIKTSSYSFYIKPKPSSQKEIEYAKSELQKNYGNYRLKTKEQIQSLIRAQSIFDEHSTKRWKENAQNKSRLKKINPIIRVGLHKESIEILELRDNNIVSNKVLIIDGQKIPEDKQFKKQEDKLIPSVTFPNGENLTVTNYTPPLSLSSEKIEELWDLAFDEIQNDSDNS